MSNTDGSRLVAELQERVDALEQQLAVYQSIMAQLSLGLHVYHIEDIDDDATLRMIDANPAVEELTGVAPTDIIGRTLDENFPDLREQGVPGLYANVIRTGEPVAFEVVYGDERVIESAFAVRALPLPNNHLAVSFENITQSKRDARELEYLNAQLQKQVSEQVEELRLFKIIVEQANDGIGFTDAQGTIIYSNPAHRTLFGYGDDIIGMSVNATVAPEGAALLEQGMQEVLTHGSWRGESINRRKDGSTFPVEVSIFTVPDEQGTLRGVVGMVRDISERKQAETELNIFRTLVESSPYSITISSLEGLLTYANPAHRLAHGYEGDAAGIALPQLMPDADELQAALGVLSAEGRWGGIITHQRFDGSTFPMQCDAFFVYDHTGAPTAAVAIERDVSEDVRQEQERRALQQQIIEAQQTAIRELSTPLLPISDNVVIMPLIGTIDSQRAQQVMEALLEGVAQHQASLVVLDITGVSVVDTQVAQTFIQAAQAVRLLGAQVMLTGIQPQIAQTLVTLGVDLSGIQTRGSLQSGIVSALRQFA